MHTSAQTPIAEYTGTLIHHAEARSSIVGKDGLTVPVLCLDIELSNQLHTSLHVEQPFPAGHFNQAQAAAHRLKKGMCVTVHAPLVAVRLVARNATHIHIVNEPQESAA